MNNPYTGTIYVKDDVVPHPDMVKKPHMMTMILVVKSTAPMGYDPTITSATEGVHKSKKHPSGDALDWRTRDFPDDLIRWVSEIKKKLGAKFVVVLESDHIHIQYNG